MPVSITTEGQIQSQEFVADVLTLGQVFSSLLPVSLSLKSVRFPASHNLPLLDIYPLSSSPTSGLVTVGLYETAVASHRNAICVRLSLLYIIRIVMLDLRFSQQRL
jgi:hypothetical protein